MSKESPILKVTFQMDFNDFYNFNMHVSKEMIDKSKKKVTIFGAVEIVLAVVFLVLNFTSQANSSLNLAGGGPAVHGAVLGPLLPRLF